MNIYINLFLQKENSYTRHFSCLRQHGKEVAVLSIARWIWLPDESEKSCSAWNRRGESLEESQGQRAWNITSFQGFVCRVREGPAAQLTHCFKSGVQPNQFVRTYIVHTEKYLDCFLSLFQIIGILAWDNRVSFFKYCLFSEGPLHLAF